MVVRQSVRREIFRLWNQFCEFTSIAGLRFLTSKVSWHVQIAAYIVFIGSLCGLIYQVSTLLAAYIRGQIITSTLKKPSEEIPLPVIYFCALMDNSTLSNFPFFEVCSQSQNASTEEFFQRLITICNYKVGSDQFHCHLQCKWTANGYCVELRRGVACRESDGNGHGNISVAEFDIELMYPTVEPMASVYLHTPTDPLLNTSHVPLIGAPHMVIMPIALNFIEVYEILEIKSLLQKRQQDSFEMCAWRRYNDLLTRSSDCPFRLYASIHPPENGSDLEEVFEPADCSFRLAAEAMASCPQATAVTRFVVECSVGDEVDTRNTISSNETVNVRIFASDTVTRRTESRRDKMEYKTLSGVGSSLALFIGFTMMSLLEAAAFFTVRKVRRDAQQDEDTLMERKNPPIKFPIPLPVDRLKPIASKVQEWIAKLRAKPAEEVKKDEVAPWESAQAQQPSASSWRLLTVLRNLSPTIIGRSKRMLPLGIARIRQKLVGLRTRTAVVNADQVRPIEVLPADGVKLPSSVVES